MSPKPLKTIVFISIGVSFLLSWVLLTRTQMTASPKPKENRAHVTQRRTIGSRLQSRQTNGADTGQHFYASDFYRTIIDNNLFRPLGWRPPRAKFPYRLLGTILPKDENTQPRAILQATAGNKTHTVTLNEKLDGDMIVVDIQPKQVTLKKARQRKTLHLNTAPWIK